MERLTFRDNTGNARLLGVSYGDGHGMFAGDKDVLNRLAAYEDAEEQGLLVRLPCKVGEVVWIAHPKYNRVHKGMFPCVSFIMAEIENGCIICKTRDEAKAALAKDTNVPDKEERNG